MRYGYPLGGLEYDCSYILELKPTPNLKCYNFLNRDLTIVKIFDFFINKYDCGRNNNL